MTEQGTRTPAQQSWFHVVNEDKSAQVDAIVTLITPAMGRAEEIASDVRALAAAVAELDQKVERLIGLDKNTNERLAALESTGITEQSVENASETWNTCTCGHHGSAHDIYNRCLVEGCPCRGFCKIRQSLPLESPGSAESAPEPVCEYCGGGGKIVHLTFDEVCGHCRLAEQAAQEPEQCPCGAMIDPCDGRCEPPALDPQIEEIITQAYLYGSARCAQGIEVGAGRDSGESIKRMLKEWETLTEMIRAYGADAREGGK